VADLNIETNTLTLAVSDGSAMNAYVAAPTGDGTYPNLIILQEAFGVNAHIRDVTDRFARLGYVAIAPELFHRTAPPGFEGSYTDFPAIMPHYQALTNDGLAADLAAAHGWLEDWNAGQPLGTIGWCLGGKVSFLASTVLPVRCSVSFYGGGIAPNAMSAGLLDRADQVKAPLLLCWGGKDAHLTPDQVWAVTAALDAAGKNYINAVFSKADHGFFCDARASYDAESAAVGLALTLGFFGQHLAV